MDMGWVHLKRAVELRFLPSAGEDRRGVHE